MGWFSEHEVFCGFFVIAEFPLLVYSAVYAIIYKIVEYDR